MNYIRRIQAENAELKRQMIAAQEEIQNFRAFVMTSPKFQTKEYGDRMDWIATTDVATRLQEICSLLFIEGGNR